MISYIIQQLQSIGFTDQEISELFGIIYNAIEQSKDPEQQVANTLNYKYIDAFSLIDTSFGGDWYTLVKVQKSIEDNDDNFFMTTPTTYNGEIQLDKYLRDYGIFEVTSNHTVTYNSSGEMDGSSAEIIFLGDSSHSLDLSAFVQYDSSGLTFDNTKYNHFVFTRILDVEYWVIVAQTDTGGPVTLSAPGSFAATANGQTEIDLSWSAVAHASSYKLEWSANGTSGWTQIGGTLSQATTSYSHTGLSNNTTYYYRISSIGDGVNYLTSGYATGNATTSDVVAAPTLTSAATSTDGLTVTLTFSKAMGASPSSIGLTFSPSKTISSITRQSGDTTKYDVVVSVAFTNSDTITCSYTPGTIVANDGGILAGFSGTGVTNNVTGVLPSASSVNITGTVESGSLLTGHYTYSDNGSGLSESGSTFKWYRSDDNSGTNKAAIVGATSITYTLTTNDIGKYIQFAVTPHNTNGYGAEVFSSYTIQVPAQSTVFTFQTNKSGAWTGSFLTTAGTLSFSSSDGQTSNSNAPSFTFADATTKTITCTLGSVASAANITYADFTNRSLVGTLNLTNLTGLTQLYLTGNSGLTGFTFPSTATIDNPTINNTGITSLNTTGITIGGYLNLSGTPLTSLTLSTNTMEKIYLYTAQLSSLDASAVSIKNTSASYFLSQGDTYITSLISPTGAPSIFGVNGCTSLTSITGFNWISTNIGNINCESCALNQTTIDLILSSLNAYFSTHTPTKDLTVNLRLGTNSAPTGGSSNTDLVNLISIFSSAGRTLTYYLHP